MFAQARKFSLKLIRIWVIFGMLVPLLAQPLSTLASPGAIPSKTAGGTITIVEGEADVTIESPTIQDASVIGCDVSGYMRIQFRGNDKRWIPISGSVDAFDNGSAESIGYFDLNIAGLTLKAYRTAYTTDNDGALRITYPSIKIPNEWGGLEAQIPSTTQIDRGGIQIYRFKLPSLQTPKGFGLDLSGQIRMASSGYEIDADGSLSLPDMGKTAECAISAGVTLYASLLGQGVIEMYTPEGAQAASLRNNRSVISRPDGLASMVPAYMPVHSYYLPVPSDLPPDAWLQGEPEAPAAPQAQTQSLPDANVQLASSMAMLAPYATAAEPTGEPSFIPPGEEEALVAGRPYEWALWEEGNYDQPLASSADYPEQAPAQDVPAAAMIGPLEREVALSPQGLELREIRASASCSKGIPIANTGFELTGVRGVISLRPNSQYVSIGVTIESSVKVASFSALKLDADAKFQWAPEFAGEISGALYVLTMYQVGGAKVSLSESDGFRTTVWMRGIVWELTVSIHAWSQWGRFHFTGSGLARIGMGKGQIWQGCVPYPCGVRWCEKCVWGVCVPYPCGVNICDGCINVPPSDMWIGGLGADFGEFVGGAYGFKAYVSFAGYTIGAFVDNRGTIRFGDVSAYRLYGKMQLAQAQETWKAAQRSGALTDKGDRTFTFLSDDDVLVNFELPMKSDSMAPLSVSDAITPVNVITQTDTLFSVKSDTPLDVSLVSPDGITITVENYDESPGGYIVGYRESVTYTLERAVDASETEGGSKEIVADEQTRWRFVSISPDPQMSHVDVSLDATAVITDMWITGTQRIDYALLEPGMHTVSVMPFGSSTEILTATLDAITGTDYTVLAVGAPASALILTDDNRNPGDFGYARVRAVNAVSPTVPITVSLGDWDVGLGYGQASDYQWLPAGVYTLSVPVGDFSPIQRTALAATSVTTLTGEAEGDLYGDDAAGIGDVNGDGYADFAVGARRHNGWIGRAYIYYGGTSGLGAPDLTLSGSSVGDALGTSVNAAGDVNGDAYDDAIVGVFGGNSGAGQAYVYYGSATGLSATPGAVLNGEASGDAFGSSAATAGDVNNDGYDDVVVAADGCNTSAGCAYVYLGSASGLATTPSVELNGDPAAEFGAAAGTAGDVNNDGYDDIIIGADGYGSYTGGAYVYYGGTGGITQTNYTLLTGEAAGDNFGWDARAAGDVNGDGYDDVLVGAYGAAPASSNTGRAYLYYGSETGVIATPAFAMTGVAFGDLLGFSVGAAGDIDGDTYSDIVVGAPGVSGNTGQAYVYTGGPTGPSPVPTMTLSGETTGEQFGSTVATLGDINGDGLADFIIGASQFATQTGRAYVYASPGAAAPDFWMQPRTITLEEGDVQSFFFSPLGDGTYPVGVQSTLDERYKVMTETQFIVDQAPVGTWSVNLVGDTTGQLMVGAVAAPNPPVISDLTVNASNLAQTLVSYRLLSDYLPATISIYANNGPITETMLVTESIGMTNTEVVTSTRVSPLYEGTAVYTITLTDENAVKGEIVTETVDLSQLESGNYTLWVRAEDGVSPPVQGYVWGTLAMARAAGLDWSRNRVRVAAEGYDSVAQLAGALSIGIDHTDTFTDHWTTAITPTVNLLFVTPANPEGTLIDGLFVEFVANTHPDVDSYIVNVAALTTTHVLTAGKTTYQRYNEAGDPIGGPISYVIFNGINPKTTYTITIGAVDWESDRTSWSDAHIATVPLGDFGMWAQTPAVTLPSGEQILTVTLGVSMTDDIFSDVDIYLEGENLADIRLKSFSYEEVKTGKIIQLGRASIPAAARMPASMRRSAVQDVYTYWAHVALTIPTTTAPGLYSLPFHGYSGELRRETTVEVEVGEPQQVAIPSNATEPLVVSATLPLVSCAQAITVTIPPQTFAQASTLEFRQATNNVEDLANYQFAYAHFFLSAFTSPGGVAIEPTQPISLALKYDKTCMGGLEADKLSLLTMAAQLWQDTGVACTPDVQSDELRCTLENLGEFALFEYVESGADKSVFLPLVLR